MITVDVSGPAVPRLSRTAIVEFTTAAIGAVRRARAASFEVSEASIVFVGDAEMKKLNGRYRGKRRTTDVLTFEGDPSAHFLGEIIISIDQARRQAAEQKHSLPTEIRYLLLHGVLHAFGFDHETDQGEMNALELKLRGRLGLE